MTDEQVDDSVRRLHRYGYPNPERIGCPGSEIIRLLARNKLPANHPAQIHLLECSPCYVEVEQATEQHQRQHYRLRIALAIGAAVAAVALALLLTRM